MTRESEPSDPRNHWSCLADLMQDRAHRHPDRVLSTFIGEDGRQSTITYSQVDRRAKSVAASLASQSQPGDRALLLFSPGIEFIVGFFGASYAGLVPVPTCYPKPGRRMPRLETAAADCDAAVLISDQRTLRGLDSSRLGVAVNKALRMATDTVPEKDFDPIQCCDQSTGSLGLLQYTSGSTSDPKGVMVSNANLMSNLESIRSSYQLSWVSDDSSKPSRGVFWLPAFHDMGLIGGILEPIYLGAESVLMSPRYFLQRPLRWLQAISEHRASFSGGPNFAYQLCVDRIDPEHARALDLSCWTTAFCGAEPVQAETFKAFKLRFQASGFQATSFCPCYGLAEATLLASGSRSSNEALLLSADRDALSLGTFVPSREDQSPVSVRKLVSCGHPANSMRVAIVEPDNNRELPNDTVGEIWLQGSSITSGYWNQPEVNAQRFQARLDGEPSEGMFCRTGDLGFLHHG